MDGEWEAVMRICLDDLRAALDGYERAFSDGIDMTEDGTKLRKAFDVLAAQDRGLQKSATQGE